MSQLFDKSWRVNFDPDRPMIIKEAMKLHLERRGGLYTFEGEVQEARDVLLESDEVCVVMPIENEQQTEPDPEHLHEGVREKVPEAQPR